MSYIVSTAVLMVAYQSDVGLGAGRQSVQLSCIVIIPVMLHVVMWMRWLKELSMPGFVSCQSLLHWSWSWRSTCCFLSGFQCCSSSLAPSIFSFICLFFWLKRENMKLNWRSDMCQSFCEWFIVLVDCIFARRQVVNNIMQLDNAQVGHQPTRAGSILRDCMKVICDNQSVLLLGS